jgi:hypothetical protein
MPQSCPNLQRPAHAMLAPRTEDEPGTGRIDLFPLVPDEPLLFDFVKHTFETYWPTILFGTLIQGAAWEVKAPGPPRRIALLDGYVTVDFGPWHFHLCIGETKGVGSTPTPPALARHRRCARAELYRVRNRKTGAPNSWGFRMFNGAGEQQMTVFLPSPFIGDDGKPLKPPHWARLGAWDDLRQRFLGLEPDPFDRSGTGFVHG